MNAHTFLSSPPASSNFESQVFECKTKLLHIHFQNLHGQTMGTPQDIYRYVTFCAHNVWPLLRVI